MIHYLNLIILCVFSSIFFQENVCESTSKVKRSIQKQTKIPRYKQEQLEFFIGKTYLELKDSLFKHKKPLGMWPITGLPPRSINGVNYLFGKTETPQDSLIYINTNKGNHSFRITFYGEYKISDPKHFERYDFDLSKLDSFRVFGIFYYETNCCVIDAGVDMDNKITSSITYFK